MTFFQVAVFIVATMPQGLCRRISADNHSESTNQENIARRQSFINVGPRISQGKVSLSDLPNSQADATKPKSITEAFSTRDWRALFTAVLWKIAVNCYWIQKIGFGQIFQLLTYVAHWFHQGKVLYVDPTIRANVYKKPPVQQNNTIRIVAISDTHMHHSGMYIPPGDILIHAGDSLVEWNNGAEAVRSFASWMLKQPHDIKVVIGGNHDKHLDPLLPGVNKLHNPKYEECLAKEFKTMGNIDYLYSGRQSLQFTHGDREVRIFGCPWSKGRPESPNRAFQNDVYWLRHSKDEKCDILVTHGPPKGILGSWAIGLTESTPDHQVGTQNVLNAVMALEPQVHIFGHMHASYGVIFGNEQTNPALPETLRNTVFANASVFNFMCFAARPAIVIDLPKSSLRRKRPSDVSQVSTLQSQGNDDIYLDEYLDDEMQN